MLAIYGARLTTFEDSEKESEHGYVRKAILTFEDREGRQVEDSQTVRPFTHICFRMLAIYGARLTTFEDSEKESEHGYVRKAILTCIPIKSHGSLSFVVIGDWGRKGEYNQSQVAAQPLHGFLHFMDGA
ncbi:hypothetical protein K1719_036613 [Acacia pycnantha]|nr:hypothetical protein K1719_036613 [Acacia pycnantha]